MQTHGTGPLGRLDAGSAQAAGVWTLSYAAWRVLQCFRVTIVGLYGRLECQDGGSVRASLLQIHVRTAKRSIRVVGVWRLWYENKPESISSCCRNCGPPARSPTRRSTRQAESLEGPTFEVMAKAASDAGTWLHAGSIPSRDADGTLYNTSLVFTPSGDLAAAYRKIHRFGFDKGEAVLMGAGAELVTVRLPGTTLGIATCYDLRFPELFRGCSMPAPRPSSSRPAGPERRRSHWTLLAQARAVENQAFVLACGTAGTHAGVPQAGHSIVVDPWEVLAEAGAGEQVLTVDFDPGRSRPRGSSSRR